LQIATQIAAQTIILAFINPLESRFDPNNSSGPLKKKLISSF
jgi:hypothetical protein